MCLLFYTAANKQYQNLTPLYIYTALRSNPSAYVEVGLENAELYKQNNSIQIEILRNKFGDRFKLTTVNFDDTIPGAVRFINEPELINKCSHVYIGDIDILIFDKNIKRTHIENMSRNKAPFSNKIRNPKTRSDDKRLSGLHFAPIDVQYPLPDFDDINYSIDCSQIGADENILYNIMSKKGYMISSDMNFRPEHGIHMRTKHHPFGKRNDWLGPKLEFDKIRSSEQKKGWYGIEKQKYRNEFKQLISEDDFQKLYFTLDIEIKNLIMILENVCVDRFQEFEHECYTYVISDYFNWELLRKNMGATFIGKMYRYLRQW